jgi:rfaE bifunctional protein kinase chain/domain
MEHAPAIAEFVSLEFLYFLKFFKTRSYKNLYLQVKTTALKTDLLSIIDSFSQHKILIIGDVMIDSYLWGKVERISPEAPVPVVTWTSQENRLGGAANVALNIQSLGATPILCSVIGADDRAKTFYELLSKQGMVNKGVIEDNERITSMKTRIISSDQQLLRVDRENDKPLSAFIEKQFILHIKKVITENNISAIIFEDYDKGSITPNVISNVVKLSEDAKIPVLVDPKKRNFLSYNNTTLFKPNFKELTEGLKVDANKNNPESLFQAAQILHKEKNIKNIMITLSEAGVFISTGKEYKLIPAHIRNIADVSGAGDTVISVAALCMASGIDPFTTAAISNTAGGLVCEKVGVIPIEKEQLKREVSQL